VSGAGSGDVPVGTHADGAGVEGAGVEGAGVEDPGVEDPGVEDPGRDPASLRIVEVESVFADLPGQRGVVVLQERDESAGRRLAFAIGLADASALAHAVAQVPSPRPFVHDLVARVTRAFDLEITAVRIVGRRGQTYFAQLDVRGSSGAETFPCRPSDGLGLALRQPIPAPVLVDERLFAVDDDVACSP